MNIAEESPFRNKKKVRGDSLRVYDEQTYNLLASSFLWTVHTKIIKVNLFLPSNSKDKRSVFETQGVLENVSHCLQAELSISNHCISLCGDTVGITRCDSNMPCAVPALTGPVRWLRRQMRVKPTAFTLTNNLC